VAVRRFGGGSGIGNRETGIGRRAGFSHGFLIRCSAPHPEIADGIDETGFALLPIPVSRFPRARTSREQQKA
jgi:hypothetical protein